ncbi:MAG TPA: lysophospholipid acyltransferase family protein [Terricaulis sp.]|nr:lysophospholipid acyltransferase family protein [Terricaulis sp.]
MTLIRSLIFALWFYLTMAVYGLFFIARTLLGGDRFVWVGMRSWSHAILFGLRWICGVRVKYEGLEHLPEGPALLASKHQATLDTLLPVQFLKEPVFVVKRELQDAPVFGFYMKRGMIPVDREAHAKALKDMLRAARAAIAKGRQIVIYPEGTRQELDAAPDYKPGVVAMYRDLGLPVTPIALNTGMSWPPSGLLRKPGVVTIKVLPPIPAGLSREEFMARLEGDIESASQALLPPQLRRSVPA